MRKKFGSPVSHRQTRNSWRSIQVTLVIFAVAAIIAYATVHQAFRTRSSMYINMPVAPDGGLSQRNVGEAFSDQQVFTQEKTQGLSAKNAQIEAVGPAKGLPLECRAEANIEYNGHDIIKWGNDNYQETAGDCCKSCQTTTACNVWVYCPEPSGCGVHQYKECWLKTATMFSIFADQGKSYPAMKLMSGSIYREEEAQALRESEAKRLKTMRDSSEYPLVYFDVEIKGVPVGRIEMVLFMRDSPLAAENFRVLASGERGIIPEGKQGAGKEYSFKGAQFYRIIDRFVDQTGCSFDTIYGGPYKDDAGGLKLEHDRKGLLSMANGGPNTNTCHFSIVMAPAPHLNGKYTIFGEVVSGIEVADKINALARGKPENTAHADSGAVIVRCGQIRGISLSANQQIIAPVVG